MKILQINKFLYNVGGAETYMFKLSEALQELGHEVKYWGMKDERNIVNDEFNSFTENINYQSLNKKSKIKTSINTVYSNENKKKLNKFLDNWEPDIVHIHNYNFQLTPAILKILFNRNIKTVQTIHDSQMVCPYHRLYNFRRATTCIKCVEGSFINCIKDRCFDNSIFKSIVGSFESYLYHTLNYYNKYINAYISPSNFLKELVSKRINKTIHVVPNFVDKLMPNTTFSDNKDSYYLYFGRVSEEKGIIDIIPFFEKLKLKLIIIGNGSEVDKIKQSEYIQYLGPKYGEELYSYISKSKYVIQPSKWYENCPMTIVESFCLGIPIIGSNHSGFKELINNGKTGFLINFNDKENLEMELSNINSGYYPELRNNSYEFYLTNLSKNKHLEKIITIYNSVLNNGE